MLQTITWSTVLCMAGFVAGCGRVYYEGPPDGGVAPAIDATPAADAAPVEPTVDAAPAVPPLDPGLIAWYPLDSTGQGMTEDATGNGHHAACMPDPASCPTLVAGVVGKAMQFDIMTHLRVANEDGFLDTPEGFTIAGWFWLEEPFYTAPLSKLLGTDSANTWQIEFADDRRPAFTTSNYEVKGVDHAPEPVEAATWVHLAGTWGGGVKRFYVNGVEKYELPFELSWDGSDIIIGGDENGGKPALMFGGRIDDVRIYDRVLALEEIAALTQAR